MVNFLKLVQNENMKIYRRLPTWIMFGFIVGLPILISLIAFLATDPGKRPDNWEVMSVEGILLMIFSTIFTVVKASESVAGEYTWGTIKLLLIRPWSRSAILLSKYISLLLFGLLFTVLSFVVSFLVNVALFGYAKSAAFEGQAADTVANSSPLLHMLESFGLQFITLIVVLTFGFMLSSAFRSSGLAIGLSIFLLVAGLIFSSFFAMVDQSWVEYILFLHLNLTAYMDGGEGPIPGHPTTFGFSLAVLAGYFILFNVVSWLVFVKRDVAA